jgi:hypothetical protein
MFTVLLVIYLLVYNVQYRNKGISAVELRHLLTVYNIQQRNGRISAVELRHLLTVYNVQEGTYLCCGAEAPTDCV